ncbi:Dyp-type peroxidase family [Bradyrhizobium sp. GM7.3]
MAKRAIIANKKPVVADTKPNPTGPFEPVLELDDIQGIAAPGLFKPHHALVYLRLPEAIAQLTAIREHLAEMVAAGAISSGRKSLDDRRQHRQFAAGFAKREVRSPLVAIAFTAQGLGRFTPAVGQFKSPAFRGGLASRSVLLGDPVDPDDPASAVNWVVGGPGNELDAMFVVAGDHQADVRALAQRIAGELVGLGANVAIQHGDVRADQPGHEHFGFDDGVSQPGIRGRASSGPDDFVTDRKLDVSDLPDAWLYGYPGQDLVWPGEFLLGYPVSGADPLIPGPTLPCEPWMRNGSFLVYRRLRQDVAGFWQTMRREAARLSKTSGFEGLADEALAARLVGRWPSGAPVLRTSDKDDPDLGADSMSNNDFRFDNNSRARADATPAFPAAKADPVGFMCPAGAHIRKVNTRDGASDMGGANASQTRRLLRVGVAFGESLADRYGESGPDPLEGDRGLLFLSIQSSIEDQFEFLQARWINNGSRPRGPGGHDMIVGQNAAAPDGIRRCHLFGAQLQSAEVKAQKAFVAPSGGGYFFLPSLTALREVVLASS